MGPISSSEFIQEYTMLLATRLSVSRTARRLCPNGGQKMLLALIDHNISHARSPGHKYVNVLGTFFNNALSFKSLHLTFDRSTEDMEASVFV